MTTNTIISLDLGATKCAAGIIEYIPETRDYICHKTCQVKLAETHSLPDLIEQIETLLNLKCREADAVCVGAAGQYNGRELHHLSGAYPYPMHFAELAALERWPNHAVIHDYDTVVCATFTSYMHNDENILRLNHHAADPYKRRVALGLGTGLGLKDGVLLASGDFWLGKNEIGHIGIINAPYAEPERIQQHQEFIHFLQAHQSKAKQQITFENILTGRGMVHLHEFLYPNDTIMTPEEISEKLANGKAPALLDLFAWYLGLFIGSVQLIFLPEGGVWITGGVAIKNIDIFHQTSFQAGIHASPAYMNERSIQPLGVMINPHHALIGAGFYAVNRLLN